VRVWGEAEFCDITTPYTDWNCEEIVGTDPRTHQGSKSAIEELLELTAFAVAVDRG
jgi:hypothetical protein